MELAARLRAGTEDDAGHAAAMHAAHIPQGFLASLGPRFLTHLYRRVARSSHGFLLVVTDGDADRPVGFVAGASDVGLLYRQFLRRDGLRAALVAAPRLARAAPAALETLRYGTGGSAGGGSAGGAPVPGEAELLAMAVDEGWRRQGLGGTLVEAFLGTVAADGAPTARVVVGAANATAVALYQRHGFEPAGELQVHAGVPSLLLRARLRRRVAR